MRVIRHQMPFNHDRLLMLCQLPKMLCQLPKNLPQLPPQRPEDLLLSPLRDKHNVVLAVPPRVTQALILFHRESPSLGRDRRFTMTVQPVDWPTADGYVIQSNLACCLTGECYPTNCCRFTFFISFTVFRARSARPRQRLLSAAHASAAMAAGLRRPPKISSFTRSARHALTRRCNVRSFS
jgi:hypothetical protein